MKLIKKITIFVMALFLTFTLVFTSSKVNAAGTSVTYKQGEATNNGYSLVLTGTAPEGSSASFTTTYTSNKYQLTSGNSMSLTLKGYAGYKITSLTLSMKSNSSSGGGKLSYTNGANDEVYVVGSEHNGVKFNNTAWYGNWSSTYVNVVKTFSDPIVVTGDFIIKIAATANSLYCESFTITYEEVISSPEQTAVNAVTPKMSLGYSYTKNIVTLGDPVTKYQKVTSIDELTDGTQVYLVGSNKNGDFVSGAKDSKSEYLTALETTINSDGSLNLPGDAKPLTVAANGTNYTLSYEGYALGVSGQNLSFGSSTSNASDTTWAISFETNSNGEIITTVKNTNSNGYKLYFNASAPRFKTYSSTQSSISLYKLTEVQATTTTYSNAEFRIKCGIDIDTTDALMDLADADNYGIYIKAGEETRYYDFSGNSGYLTDSNNSLYYVVISLGDVINISARPTTKFTIGAYVQKASDSSYVLSDTIKTYSVASLVKEYYTSSEFSQQIKDAVKDLYNYFTAQGYYQAN